LDEILASLGLGVYGSALDKKARLRIYLGLIFEPEMGDAEEGEMGDEGDTWGEEEVWPGEEMKD
jgi:hypothetical protein